MRRVIFALLSLMISFNVFARVTTAIPLRDKIGQMLLIGFQGKTVNAQSSIIKAIEKNNIGGVILFDYDAYTKTFNRNIESPAQVKQLNHDLQQFTTLSNSKHHRASLPLLISVDYEGGKVSRLSEQYGFPATQSAAVVGAGSVEGAEANAAMMAQVLNDAGFNLNFSPVLDVNVNPDNPIISKKDRSFSSDPAIVASFANIYARYFLNQNIQCAYKHFPGHGSATSDSHLGFVDVSDTWMAKELEPYWQLLNTDNTCGVIMSAHLVNRQLDASGLPATLSHKILTGLLRDELHFSGVIMTDDMQMKAISDNYDLKKAVVMAINAGADMLIFGNNLTVAPQDPKALVDMIEASVLSGEISAERIDEAYQRIVTLKQFQHK